VEGLYLEVAFLGKSGKPGTKRIKRNTSFDNWYCVEFKEKNIL